ncbi:ImmA/IrrE family metallo-endopeptidase [Staphylococcus nepalensis]|uniref:ImmA/IrrE family metallo-endopeptidase n=1 Tax=Staphylococcus nepalensis TaxID=214473 RepID=UPI001A97D8E7|nr:ImmA/IrrE family metallo-endopeptidase [Staphylococcus nepalensis]MBO1222566.1 ImmA/IrrE family metallo-endopeptidase [Staphylococcus nepalensis]
MNELIDKSKQLSRKVVTALTNQVENFDIYDVINDLEGFIEQFNVKVFYSNMDGFDFPNQISGYSIVNSQGYPEIVINANDSLVRQRFTMAHEFGHIIMHWDWLNNQSEGLDKEKYEILFRKNGFNNEYRDLKEVQANEFAAELLLPHELIKQVIGNIEDLKSNPISFNEMKKRVAAAFNVSESFANIQLLKIVQGEFK